MTWETIDWDRPRPEEKGIVKGSILLALRWSLGLLMIWAAMGKLVNAQEFLVALRAYQLPMPDLILRLVAIGLPWLELLCGLGLLAGWWLETNLGLVTVLMALFVLATGQAWARGLEIACGCFGGSLEEETFLGSVPFAFFRNLVLTAIAGALWMRLLRSQMPNSKIPTERENAQVPREDGDGGDGD